MQGLTAAAPPVVDQIRWMQLSRVLSRVPVLRKDLIGSKAILSPNSRSPLY